MNNIVCDCPEYIKVKCRCTGCSKNAFDCFHRNSVIMASAGTGKTYSLAMRYLQLLSFGVELKEILAVTFTRKAAGEIFDEIISNLLKLIASENHCRLAEKDKLLEMLKKLLTSGDANISTIDSFFGSLLRTYAPELGISGEITMFDEYDERPTRKVVRKFLREASAEEKDELRELIKSANSDEQINFESSMCKIIADMHSPYLKNLHDVKGAGIWGVPFDFEKKLEKYDRNSLLLLSGKVQDIVQNKLDGSASEKFGKLSNYLLPENIDGNLPEEVNYILKSFNTKNEEGWLFEKVTSITYTKTIVFSGEDAEVIRQAVRCILRCRLEKCRKKSAAEFAIIKKYEEIYDSELRQKGIIKFDDQPLILRSSDEADTFHLTSSETMNMEERLDAVINHYLFDEFQDTSHDQWYIFSNLVDEILSSRDDRFRSFFCVGDIKQSIYQWRGGDPYLFEQVIEETRQKSKDLGYDPQSELVKSFRSSQDILDSVNIIFSPGADPKAFDNALKRLRFKAHESAKKNTPGFTAVIDVSLVDSDQLLENQAQIISRVLKEISPFDRPDKMTVGVLMQENKKIEQLAEKLKEVDGNLPISIDGCLQVKTSMAFTVLSKLIVLSEHPSDAAARGLFSMLAGSAGTGFQSITPADIAEKMGFETADDFDCSKLSVLIKKDIFEHGLCGFIQHYLDAFGDGFSNFDYERIDAARNLAESFSGTPEEFIRAVDVWCKQKDQSVESTVQFMTIHKAKGLGFDIVFLPDMASRPYTSYNSLQTAHPSEIKDGTRWVNHFPAAEIYRLVPEMIAHHNVMDEERLFEECCKFYVAVTRAKRAMYIFADSGNNAKASKDGKKNDIHFQHVMCRKLIANGKNAPAERLNNIFDELTIPADALIYASGNENWFVIAQEYQPIPVPEFENRQLRICPSSKQRTLASHQDEDAFKTVPELRFSSRSASNTGTVLHGLFEEIEYITPDFSAQEFLAGREIEPDISEIFIKSLAEDGELFSALAKPACEHILWRERRFLVKVDSGNTVPGAFDRVTIYLDGSGRMERAEILDYKSDNVSSTQEIISRHSGQMKLYRECLSKMTGIPQEKIKLYLAALRIGKIAEVE